MKPQYEIREAPCMAKKGVPHGPHDWWYTSSGGGHELHEHDETGTERNQRRYRCPGVCSLCLQSGCAGFCDPSM